MELAPGLAVYKPRKPKQTLLWQILADYFDQFEQSYDSCYTKTYGFLRRILRYSKPLILSQPLRSISRSSHFSWCVIMVGTPTVCGATGRSVKPKREEWRQRLLPAWKLSTFQITGPHGSHRRCGGSVPQGHLLRGHIKKIWEVDPLSCPRCHAEMKIISFIVQPDVIKKILVYLELWEEFSKRRPPPLALAAEKAEVATGRIHDLFDDGWSGYEDPWLDVHSL